jgi:ATP-binding cassette subfamily C protein
MRDHRPIRLRSLTSCTPLSTLAETTVSGQKRRSDLSAALLASRSAFVGVAVFSALLNLLYLTGSFYMLEVYDRVLPGRSVPTLVGITVLAAMLYGIQAILDVIRSRLLVRVGAHLAESASDRVHRLVMSLPLAERAARNLQPLRDLDQVRSFMSTVGPAALFDLPWMPFYLGICYLFHPWIGLAATLGGLGLVVVAFMTEVLSHRPSAEASDLGGLRASLAEANRRNAEAIHAMGMGGHLGSLWAISNSRYLAAQQKAADVAATLGGLSKVMRLALQSGVLAIGAFLVINQQATAGIIIASSILTARALAPIEIAISQWRGFIAARRSWRRLHDLLARWPDDRERLPLPAPSHSLAVHSVSVAPPGVSRIVVQGATFRLTAGQGLGIIGPSASGKSSLARAIVGVWRPIGGKVCLDGASLDQWSPEQLGPQIGYLPQDMGLFAGTVAQNIARFDPQASAEAVIAAAIDAGVHDLIVALPDGYGTQIGESGLALSAGQRQRIGLARALFGNPFLVVLDEPNANLDRDGDDALTRAIESVRARGGIVIVVAHRPSALAGVDMLLVMQGGRMSHFGRKEAVLRTTLQPVPALAAVRGAAGVPT